MISKIKSTKAAILFKQGKPLLITRIDLPEKLFRGQVLVRNFYSGVCGSQLGEIDGVKGKDKYLPHLLGHEAVGEVIETGPGVKKVKKNDNVLLHWMPGSGISAMGPELRWNNQKINAGPITTFSNYSVISENRLTKIKQNLKKNKEILLLGCTTSTAIGAIKKLAKIENKQIAAVAGCGAIGLALIKTLKFYNVKNIIAIDINNKKLKIAKKFGIDNVILRPKDISNDKATDYQVILHAINAIKDDFDLIAYVRPTTPFRKVAIFDRIIRNFFNKKKYTSLRTVHEEPETSYKSYEIINGKLRTFGFLKKNIDESNNPRQGFKKTFRANGYLDIYRKEIIIKKKQLFGRNVKAYITEFTPELDSKDQLNYLKYYAKNTYKK